MGLLAESKSRTKISRDPNNTKWTRDTTTFGQKILRSQGWEPGQFLGAQDSSHSELHTAANASYIRVTLKDDMKGLGYNKSKADEVTGLDVFSDLLSRLNGKSEAQVEVEKESRLVVKTHRYVELKWGPMRFVRGGLLVGDTIKEQEDSSKDAPEEEPEETSSTKDSKKERSKKRKAESLEDSNSESSDDDDEKKKKKRRKEERKAKKKQSESTPTDASEAENAEDTSAKKKDKKKKSKKDRPNVSSGGETTESDDVSETTKPKDSGEELKESKKARKERKKKEKKEKKEKEKKEKKKRRKQDGKSPDTEMSDAVQQTSSSSALTTGQSTPAISRPMANRNFVRSRFIAQKMQATLDPKALSQIFMVKAQ